MISETWAGFWGLGTPRLLCTGYYPCPVPCPGGGGVPDTWPKRNGCWFLESFWSPG